MKKSEILSNSKPERLYTRFVNYYASRPILVSFPKYNDALLAFFDSLGWERNMIPDFFIYPERCFYYKKRPSGIFSYYEFDFGIHKSNRISSRTFPSFLRYFNIPEGPSDLRNALLIELKDVLQKNPLNTRQILLQEIARRDLSFSHYLQGNIIRSSEKNLYYRAPKEYGSPFVFRPMIILKDPRFRKGIVTRYLSEIVHDSEPYENFSSWPYTFPSKSILYYGSGHYTRFGLVSWRDGFHFKKVSDSDFPVVITESKHSDVDRFKSQPQFPVNELALSFPVKSLPYMKKPVQMPSNAAAWLYHLTGGNIELADRIAKRLAYATSPSPNGKNITIICTRENAHAHMDMLKQVFGSMMCTAIYRIPSGAALQLPSLNQLCRSSGLRNLFVEQSVGKGVVLARDSDVSDTAKPILNKLISGKSIPVTTPYFPTQHLYNKTHIICISQNPARAFELSRKLKADLIDFSASELPLTNFEQLSYHDVAWLRTVFLPHGLTEETKKTRTESVQNHSDWVSEFLRDWCAVRKGSLSSKTDTYNAYCACYRHTHPGLTPPLTEGRFIKQIKKRLGHGELSKVTYYKVRAYQRMFFVGLVCPTELPPPAVINASPTTDSFTEYLFAIHEHAPNINLNPALGVSVQVLPK